MKFGVQIENHLGCSFDAVSKIASEAERLHFDGLFMCDHLIGRNEDTAKQPCLDPWVTLGALARSTRRLQLGTLVAAVGFRNPAILAKMAATLDQISAGRTQLSIGAGWYEPEYVAYGIPFPPTKTRMQQLREAARIIKALWTEDRPTITGPNYTIKEAWAYPKPRQPAPKLWIGGIGDKTLLRIVAEHADGWNATGTPPEDYERKLKLLNAYCEAKGRNIDKIERSYYSFALTGKNEAEFKDLFDRHYSAFKRTDEAYDAFVNRARRSGRSFVGTVDEVIEKIDAYRKMGVTYIIFYFPDKDETGIMRQFEDHVIPHFQDA